MQAARHGERRHGHGAALRSQALRHGHLEAEAHRERAHLLHPLALRGRCASAYIIAYRSPISRGDLAYI